MKNLILTPIFLILILSSQTSAQQKDIWTTFTTDEGLADNSVRDILEASDGALWFGTWRGGVSRYQQGSWTTLGKETNVTIKIYNAAGRLVKVLRENESFFHGNNVVYWDGIDKWDKFCTSGLYFVTIEAGDKIAKKTLMVLNE